MAKFLIIIIVFLLIAPISFAQDIFYGYRDYIEYHRGNLPIVISVPHGGRLTPSSIPDRTCFNPILIPDLNTQEMAMEIALSLKNHTGCYPHIIYCNLKRSKLDCNRNINEGACGNPVAIRAWIEYHDFIDTAQSIANQENNNSIFFIDLHGHGKPYQRIELGYLLYGYELELSDSLLNTPQYISHSSIQNLAAQNSGNRYHSDLLRGETALGTILSNKGYPSIPSMQIPSPGDTTIYYRGGYTTSAHTCIVNGNIVNGVQMELNFSGIRDNAENRKNFADSLSLSLIEYLAIHRNTEISGCGFAISSTYNEVMIFPNPINPEQSIINVTGLPPGEFGYKIIDMPGQTQCSGIINGQQIEFRPRLSEGFYLLVIFRENRSVYIAKLLVNQ